MITDAKIIEKIKKYIGRELVTGKETKNDLLEKTEEFMDVLATFDGQVQGAILEAFKDKTRLDQVGGGEFISNPVGVVDGTGEVFGLTERNRGGLKIEVSLALDCSGSMSRADGVEYNYQAGGQVPNELGIANPLFLGPRTFFASLVMRYVYNSFNDGIAAVGADQSMSMNAYCFGLGHQGMTLSGYGGEVWVQHPNNGGGTPILPLWKKIALQENLEGDRNANRLDLIITDGEFNSSDIDRINEIQYDRVAAGGTLSTVIVNVAPEKISSWSVNNAIMDFGSMFFTASPAQLAQVFQLALMDLFVTV